MAQQVFDHLPVQFLPCTFVPHGLIFQAHCVLDGADLAGGKFFSPFTHHLGQRAVRDKYVNEAAAERLRPAGGYSR